MNWTVIFSKKADKQRAGLPRKVSDRLALLAYAIEARGPVQPAMPHFGKLKGWPGEVYHCHLTKGRPTYVAIWKVEDSIVQLVEVIYVGTHEKAPY
ncbi:cytotoxic translational repressor of toxin-antitoxin stability system [Desulfovibrio sulfodismutans]|uniref:Cytotoxic translational repressor of toxin-antitoxin stability system n=1 Tax=Desulfolutivibrio sulfodismutans TaxID=63561 RepID=A0A7K3NQP7_9BACT|nr:cytotoxic translational repressor of toxin-antitoxin stability system [Desulfolutivibrio sulfodismutans]NDY57529.1 cytotoxic translational repressor of toxin-antitoxin stability system [Desulfolutivibrio sulfodismutans]QLA14341.1 cytotoxic translational repressor of toxin-antitoxin stability system [Desulfolutivibrio sulfodismutans DSM 3696]